jgi:hypothetical protein
MAKMYGQLPSVVLNHATTYDMLVTDALLSWENEQYERAQGKVPTPNLSQEEMKSMLARVKKSRSENGQHSKKV